MNDMIFLGGGGCNMNSKINIHLDAMGQWHVSTMTISMLKYY